MKAFKNIVGKGENAGNKVPTKFSTQPDRYHQFNQSVKNVGVAFVKGACERNELFEKINSNV